MMITLKGIVSVAFLKKSCFTGSCKTMNFMLDKHTAENNQELIRAAVWRGPYNFLTTKEEKVWEDFTFDLQGLMDCELWLNENFERNFENNGKTE